MTKKQTDTVASSKQEQADRAIAIAVEDLNYKPIRAYYKEHLKGRIDNGN